MLEQPKPNTQTFGERKAAGEARNAARKASRKGTQQAVGEEQTVTQNAARKGTSFGGSIKKRVKRTKKKRN